MKIKATDIRLGLWVNTPREDQNPFRIDQIDFLNENVAKVGMNVHKYTIPGHAGLGEVWGHPLTWELPDLSGIPITIHHVEDCGFKDDEPHSILMIGDHELVYYQYIPKEGQPKWTLNGKEIQLDYLHELQDLYRSLAKKELEINWK